MKHKIGILLVNLGTPNSPKSLDVYRYLIEFLTDSRVIDLPWIQRQLIVRGFIVPFRYRQSAACYKQIWRKEGSPLLIYSQSQEKLLQQALGTDYKVKLGMRYQKPSLQSALSELLEENLEELIVLPLFPQYASATTGSVHQKIMELLQGYLHIPKVTFINNFATHPKFIHAFTSLAQNKNLENYDHFLFSYHSLPQRQLKKLDLNKTCLRRANCCEEICSKNFTCYSAQCYATTQALVEKLKLKKDQYSLSFQSRLGKDPWQQPYTIDVIKQLASKGKKNVLVFCPSFVSDCLETLYEIGYEYAQEFKHAGGNKLELLTSLNDNLEWIEALKTIIMDCKK